MSWIIAFLMQLLFLIAFWIESCLSIKLYYGEIDIDNKVVTTVLAVLDIVIPILFIAGIAMECLNVAIVY